MELYEELCRFSGIWDFAINLSGADLPLRSVEDLAFTLAPYRDEIIFNCAGGRGAAFKASNTTLLLFFSTKI